MTNGGASETNGIPSENNGDALLNCPNCGGGGKLTAEQVRESIERHFGKVAVLDDGKPVEWRDDWVCKVGIDYKGITDELNAAMGGSADVDDAFALLDEIREAGRISYDDYSQLFDAIAAIGGGECEMEPIEWHGFPKVNYICSACDASVYDAHPNFCPRCGRKVKR